MPADTARTLDADKSDGEREIERIFALQKKAYAENPFPSYDHRIAALDKVIRLVEAHEEQFFAAINADFSNRSKYETIIGEILTTVSGAKNTKKNLKKWMRHRGVATPLHMLPAKSKIETATAWGYRHYLAVELPYRLGDGPGNCRHRSGQPGDDKAK